MAFNLKFFKLFKALLPKSHEFNLTITRNLTNFFASLTAIPDNFREFIDNIWGDIFPTTTRSIELWENQFGIRIVSDDASIRKSTIDTQWKMKGGQSAQYLEDQLHNAGFTNLFVYENNPKIDPNTFLNSFFVMTCDNTWACCGNDRAYCGKSDGLGYILANGYIPETSDTRDYLAVCDGDTITPVCCGQDVAVCGYFEHYILNPVEYEAPTDPNYWDNVFFVGGNAVYGSNIIVDGERQITNYSIGSVVNITQYEIVFIKLSDGFMYKKSINDLDNETQLTTYAVSWIGYVGDRNILFSDVAGYLYIKSVNDLDNETQLTTYLIDNFFYFGNNILVFRKQSDGFMYKKSINDLDNETQLTDYFASPLLKINNQEILFFKGGPPPTTEPKYRKSINDLNNETIVTSYDLLAPLNMGNGIFIFRKVSDNKFYKKRFDVFDAEEPLTTFTSNSSLVQKINNTYFMFQKSSGGHLFIKSISDIDNEIEITTYNVAGSPIFIGYDYNKIIFRDSIFGFMYVKNIGVLGGLLSIEVVDIDSARRDELETLILKIKPVHTWAGMMVEYY